MLRGVTVFTTGAGTANLRGLGVLRPGRFFGVGSKLRHWGLIVQTEDDFEAEKGYCIELDRDGEIIFPKITKWEDRLREDAQPEFKYSTKHSFTVWRDDEITQMAEEICTKILGGKYEVRHRNCQAMLNILKDVINPTNPLITPYRNLGSKIKGGKPVLDLKDYIDVSVDMETTRSQPKPDWEAGEVGLHEGDDDEERRKERMEERFNWDGLFKFDADFIERCEDTMGSHWYQPPHKEWFHKMFSRKGASSK